MEKEKLSSFNLPAYGPSVGEVTTSVKESGVFDMASIKLFEQNTTILKVMMCLTAPPAVSMLLSASDQ